MQLSVSIGVALISECTALLLLLLLLIVVTAAPASADLWILTALTMCSTSFNVFVFFIK